MEPILNEHEVIKFLVAKGGRCTNFELVSNFRGVLNDPHCKAEARLRFKDIINTVATVGEFQNVKYIELKRDHGLNNVLDSFPPQPSSLTSDCSSSSSYTSPLSQSFQPYWRYRLSTSKQQLPPPQKTYHRSVSEYALEHPQEDQVVPCQRQEVANYFSGDFSDDSGQTSQSLPFYSNRSRAVSEPPSHHRRFSSSDGSGLRQDGYQHHEQQPHRYQKPGYQHHEQQLSGYQHHEPQNPGYHLHENQIPVFQNHENQPPGYQHHQNQSPGYRANGQLLHKMQQAGYQYHQTSEDRNSRHQDVRSQHDEQQYREPQPGGYHHLGHQSLDYSNNIGQRQSEQQFLENQPVGYQQQLHQHPLPVAHQYQHPKEDLIRQQRVNEKHLSPHPDREKHLRHQDSYRSAPAGTTVQRSSSGRRSGDSFRESQGEVSRTKPESSFSRRIESLHGIRANDTSRDFSSLPYESPSGYSISDISLQGTNISPQGTNISPQGTNISPQGTNISLQGTNISPQGANTSSQGANDLATEDLQTSANLRNVARALFKDPSKTSRRASYEHSPRSENMNSSIIGLPNTISNANHNQRSNVHSSSNQTKHVDNPNAHLSSNKGQGYGIIGLPDRPGSFSEISSPGHVGSVDYGPSIPNRSGSMDSGRINKSSNRSGLPSIHSDYNRANDFPNPNHSRLDRTESPRTSINSSPRPLVDSKRHSPSSIRSNHSVSMNSLDSEKELPNNSTEIERSGTTPPPLPPDRRKKLLPASDDKNVDNNTLEPPVSCSGGKVKDRVQHFDDMEKQRRNTKRTHSPLTPLANKENVRAHHKGLGNEDDVSISVVDPKLRREWFVKSSQCDYHALSGLLKKEPKLAALKDTAMGYTALHWAAKQGDANVVKLIAGAYKCNPNVRSNGGYTPVHLATLYKHDMIVHLLVHTYGADASVRDYSGKRADQYPIDYVKVVAGHQVSERRPLKSRPPEPQQQKEVGSSFLRMGSLNLRKSSRKSAVFASVRGSTRNWGSASELRLGGHSSMRKKLHKSMISAPERIGELEKKNDSDSDSTYGFPSKKQDS